MLAKRFSAKVEVRASTNCTCASGTGVSEGVTKFTHLSCACQSLLLLSWHEFEIDAGNFNAIDGNFEHCINEIAVFGLEGLRVVNRKPRS